MAHRRRMRSILDPYKPYLHERLAAGCENAVQLWREIREQGYAGSRSVVSIWVAEQRQTQDTLRTRRRGRPPTPRRAVATTAPRPSGFKELASLQRPSESDLIAVAVNRLYNESEHGGSCERRRLGSGHLRSTRPGSDPWPFAPRRNSTHNRPDHPRPFRRWPRGRLIGGPCPFYRNPGCTTFRSAITNTFSALNPPQLILPIVSGR